MGQKDIGWLRREGRQNDKPLIMPVVHSSWLQFYHHRPDSVEERNAGD